MDKKWIQFWLLFGFLCFIIFFAKFIITTTICYADFNGEFFNGTYEEVVSKWNGKVENYNNVFSGILLNSSNGSYYNRFDDSMKYNSNIPKLSENNYFKCDYFTYFKKRIGGN